MYSLSDIAGIAISLVLVMFSATLHEVAHGYAAYRLGDPTAKMAGRLTLNPKAHIDPTGSVVLPLIMAIAGGPIFAFAKPVPYNPNNLRNPVRDEVIVAFAGPACNIAQAAVGAAVLRLLWRFAYPAVGADASIVFTYIAYVLSAYIYINLQLAFFNLIPLPPLDGSSIVSPLLHGEARVKYYEVQHYAMAILLIALYVLPMVLRVDPIGIYLDATAGRMFDLMMG